LPVERKPPDQVKPVMFVNFRVFLPINLFSFIYC
jgi:hypothetical protein